MIKNILTSIVVSSFVMLIFLSFINTKKSEVEVQPNNIAAYTAPYPRSDEYVKKPVGSGTGVIRSSGKSKNDEFANEISIQSNGDGTVSLYRKDGTHYKDLDGKNGKTTGYGNAEKDREVYANLMRKADIALSNGDLEAHAKAAQTYQKYLESNLSSDQILSRNYK